MKLEEYRLDRKFSYDDLAKKLGLTKTTTFNICQEKINCISLHNAHIIVTKTHGIVDYPELLWGDC